MEISSSAWGAAMLAAARQRASVFKPLRDGAYVNGWWRGGDSPNVQIYADVGAFKDHKVQESGGARDFAERALGLSLRELWDQYGAGIQAGAPAAAQKPREEAPSSEMAAAWETMVDAQLAPCLICDGCREETGCEAPRDQRGREWLTAERGIPDFVEVGSGVGTLCAATVEAWPAALRPWLLRKLSLWGCDAAVLPWRNALSNRVEGFTLRALAKPQDGSDRSLNLPGRFKVDAGGVPRGFGWCGTSLRAPLLVVCEGGPDTLTAEALCAGRLDAAAVGAVDSGALGSAWAEHLVARNHGRVVVVPHLDPERRRLEDGTWWMEPAGTPPHMLGVGQLAALELVRTMRVAGRSADLFRWVPFHEALRRLGIPSPELCVRDLNDAAREMRKSGGKWSDLRAAFWRAVEPGTHA